jgi:hypothetical protein
MGIPQRKIYDPVADGKPVTSKKGDRLFLKGPLPFEWIAQACPDPASRLALIVRAFMEIEGKDRVRISMKICRHAGIVNRYQRRRCLARLAATGLFEVSAAHGRSPVIRKKW